MSPGEGHQAAQDHLVCELRLQDLFSLKRWLLGSYQQLPRTSWEGNKKMELGCSYCACEDDKRQQA